MNNEILTKLALPFHPSRIIWKPGALNSKKDKALALAYADVRAYQNRLDEVCGMDWAVTYTPWGDRLICHLTVDGITRSSTGEADSQAERSEIAGTASEAQAFKRACAMFGLGRYLYNLPSVWIEYDKDSSRFTEKGKARLHGIVVQHYQRAMDGVMTEIEAIGEAEGEGSPVDPTVALRQLLDELGSEMYGEQWPQVRLHNINRITGDKPQTLTGPHIQTIINGLNKLKTQRNGVAA